MDGLSGKGIQCSVFPFQNRLNQSTSIYEIDTHNRWSLHIASKLIKCSHFLSFTSTV